MREAGSIVFATSIPLSLSRRDGGVAIDGDYQKLCLQSWQACGFRVLSLNHAEEIPVLAARHPEVEFVPTRRDASAMAGRRLPFIADMLALLAEAPQSLACIANSDILFDPAADWGSLAARLAGGGIVAGQRHDAKALNGWALHNYIAGFDYFFLGKATLAGVSASSGPFAIGLPWWDYWLPLCVAFKGGAVACLEQAPTLHLVHESPMAPRSPLWRRLALALAGSIAEAADKNPAAATSFATLCALSRDLSRVSHQTAIEQGACDAEFVRLAELSILAIRRTLLRLDEAPSASLPVRLPVFENLAGRAAAGQAAEAAMRLERQGRMDQAAAHYRTALAGTPGDAGILSAYGTLLFRQGQMAEAVHHLERAAQVLPKSSELLNRLAAALHGMGRRDEAVAALERALETEPLHGLTYYSLAAVLRGTERQAEPLLRLEKHLAETPDFPEGEAWHRRIQQMLSP